MLHAFVWWLLFLALGLAVLPVTFTLFRKLPDRGYGFSKAIGLLLFGYLYWILVTAGMLPNTRLAVVGVLLIVVALALIVLRQQRGALFSFVRARWKLLLTMELVFAAVFAVWGVIRSYTPEIAHTEQPMDFAMLNGILRSAEFPPNDPWFAGEPISYYYFGYLMAAGMTKVTGIASSISYNLALLSLAGMAATGAMSLVYNLVTSMRGAGGLRIGLRQGLLFSVVGVVLLLFIGNLVGLLEFFQTNGIGPTWFWSWISIDGVNGVSRGSGWYPDDNWWWWRSTRVINSFDGAQSLDFTITEFPFFSFMLGDLHPHVMSLPFTLLAVGLSYNVMRSSRALGLWWLWERPLEVLGVVLALGALGFLNVWDLPTFVALFFAAMLLRALHARARGQPGRFRELGVVAVVIVAGVGLLYSPFYALFDSQAEVDVPLIPAVLPVREAMTRQVHFFLVWGPLLVLSLALVAGLAWARFGKAARGWLFDEGPKLRRSTYPGATRWYTSTVFWALALPLAPFVIWIGVELGLTAAGETIGIRFAERSFGDAFLAIGSRFWHLLPLFLVISLGLGVLFDKARREGSSSAPIQFALLVILVALFLTLGAELFRIADVFGNRMNTVFKFYYQAWTLFAVGGAVSLAYWVTRRTTGSLADRFWKHALLGVFAVVIAAAFIYVPPAAYNKAGEFQPSPTLDGLATLRDRERDEYLAVAWLDENVEDDAVIVEGLPSRTDYNPRASRISQRTGIPTILGWPGHEQQWGRDRDTDIAERIDDVTAIYTSEDVTETQLRLARYGVSYVIVGDVERATYGAQVEERFESFMERAYPEDSEAQSRVVIYRRSGTP